MSLHILEARWIGRDDFLEVDYVANIEEAKDRAREHQLDRNVRANILWTEFEGVIWGHSKVCTFRMKPI